MLSICPYLYRNCSYISRCNPLQVFRCNSFLFIENKENSLMDICLEQNFRPAFDNTKIVFDLETYKSATFLHIQTKVRNMLCYKREYLCTRVLPCLWPWPLLSEEKYSFTCVSDNILSLPIDRFMGFSSTPELEWVQGLRENIWICTRLRAMCIFLPVQLLARVWQNISCCYHFAAAMERIDFFGWYLTYFFWCILCTLN